MRIGRYDHPHKCVSFAANDAPHDATIAGEPVWLEAEDGGLSSAILYDRGACKTVVCFMHPQADMSRHYAIPALVEAGFAAFGQNSRYLNNDTHCIHELLLLDVAAGQRFLRARGYENVVLVGNSGGGSLFAFYQAQASLAPPGRLTETPAGDKVDLNAHDLPAADAYVMLAAHLGEGQILMHMIDPSVTDEGDPLSCDASLDPYDPDNGYRPPPESSRYSEEFVDRYRAAQRRRVARIDATARRLIAERNQARGEIFAGGFGERTAAEQARTVRRAAVHPPMIVHRTEADLRALDTSLDPSARDAGTLFSYRPDLTNYMELGFARVTTPKAWLSTWSGAASHAALERNAPAVAVPSLVVNYDGDNAIFPADAPRALDLLGAADKRLVTVAGDHYGFAPGTQRRSGAPLALAEIVAWLRERFPA
jgi:hypothetical protein